MTEPVVAILSRENGGIRVHPVAPEDYDVDQFYDWAQAEEATLLQVMPPDEHLMCAVSTGADGACLASATHAIIKLHPSTDRVDQWTSCPAHLTAAMALVLYGPDTSAPRAVWN